MLERLTTPHPVLSNRSVLPQNETIALLLDKSKRRGDAVPIRRAFVQDTEPVQALRRKPGPLHKLIRHEHALDLLLLLYALTAGGDFGAVERSETWARATGISFEVGGAASAKISRLWRVLENEKLIRRGNHGRFTKVTKLLEDGSGDEYTTPSFSPEAPRKEVYFRLPFDYWRNDLHKNLDMSAKTVLLIAMSLRATEFPLPQTRQFATWYGISESTIRRGIETLKMSGVMRTTKQQTYETTETATGYGERWLYAFNPPYDLNVSNRHKKEKK